MPTIFGSVRRLVFTPELTDVTFAKRGFPGVSQASQAVTQRLELIPQTVVCGFEWGIDARSQWEVERRLAAVDPELRGFACEGVTMAFTILDAMGRGHRTRDLLRGAGSPHVLLAYIGMGFAMARLPRRLWPKVVPDLTGDPYYPTMSWLAVDGYGFDRAYFDTRRWVDEQAVPRPYDWEGSPGYFTRAVDQGIGRALWFIRGARVPEVAASVNSFASHRRADLWSGVGLAASFAGGSDAEGLAALARAADEHSAELAMGAVLATRARSHAGFVPPHAALAASALSGLTVEAASALADDTAVRAAKGGVPAYELWRQNIAAHFRRAAAAA
jgi:enediyne biosynthesis protein E2